MRLLTTDFLASQGLASQWRFLNKVFGTGQRLTDCGQFAQTQNRANH